MPCKLSHWHWKPALGVSLGVSLVLYAFKATIRESAINAFKENLSTDCYIFKSFSKVGLDVLFPAKLKPIVSSSTIDKIYEITLFTKIGTKSALFTKIGTKFS